MSSADGENVIKSDARAKAQKRAFRADPRVSNNVNCSIVTNDSVTCAQPKCCGDRWKFDFGKCFSS